MTATADTEQLVLREDKDGVAVLSFNRPDRANAYTVPMEAEYYRQLQECERDPAVRVIVVTGAGRTFCPGMDSGTLSAQANDGAASTYPHKRTAVTYPRTIRKPIIAAINGACAGIGLIIAMNCDLRFTTSQAKITTSFSQRGIMAEHGLGLVAAADDRPVAGARPAVQRPDRAGRGGAATGPGRPRLRARDLHGRDPGATPATWPGSPPPSSMGIIKQQVYEALESTQDEARVTGHPLVVRHLQGRRGLPRGHQLLPREARTRLRALGPGHEPGAGPASPGLTLPTCIVTGGTRGIGAAITRRIARDGDHVAAIYRSDDRAARGVRGEARRPRASTSRCTGPTWRRWTPADRWSPRSSIGGDRCRTW